MRNNRFKLILAVLGSLLVLAVLASFIFLAGRSMQNKALLKELKAQDIPLAEGFTVTAQTGCLDTVENSYISAKTGIRSGAQAIEADICFRKDGTPVLAAKLSRADENAVELERVFKYLVDFKDTAMVLNLKQVTNLKEIDRLAVKYKLTGRLYYTGVTESQAAYVQYTSPDIPFYIDCKPDKNKLNDPLYCTGLTEAAMGLGGIGIHVDSHMASKNLVDAVQGYGLKISVYNVEKEIDMYKMLKLHVNTITTLNPDLLLKTVFDIRTKLRSK